MYSYKWDKKTRGFKLTTQTGKYVASELRPVFAEELTLLGFDEHFHFDPNEQMPLMWAKLNTYIYNGEEVVKLHETRLGKPLDKEYLVPSCKLLPVDLTSMVAKNKDLMEPLVVNTLKRIKEMYELYHEQQDMVYIAFSGGKDSKEVLKTSVFVSFGKISSNIDSKFKFSRFSG